MSAGTNPSSLLRWEVGNLQDWLAGFEPAASGRPRRAILGSTGEYVIIERLPLPDGYRPDEIDVLLLIDHFPSLPPVGLYVQNRGTAAVVRQLGQRFNAFRDEAHHDALSIPGYTWICYVYAGNRWSYKAAAPNRGDNLRKFLTNFFSEL